MCMEANHKPNYYLTLETCQRKTRGSVFYIREYSKGVPPSTDSISDWTKTWTKAVFFTFHVFAAKNAGLKQTAPLKSDSRTIETVMSVESLWRNIADYVERKQGLWNYMKIIKLKTTSANNWKNQCTMLCTNNPTSKSILLNPATIAFFSFFMLLLL